MILSWKRGAFELKAMVVLFRIASWARSGLFAYSALRRALSAIVLREPS